MDEVEASGYWCHMCAQMVNPVMDMEIIKCPFCESGFIEEVVVNNRGGVGGGGENDLGSERALSPWAQIFLNVMSGGGGGGGGRLRRTSRRESEESEEDDDDDDDDNEAQQREESELDRRRRTSSAAILHMLAAGLQSSGGGGGAESGNSEVEREREPDHHHREREGVILINPFNQAIILQGPFGLNHQNHNNPSGVPGSLGDYLIGPGLDLLLQHLAENDPNRYGTPPAKKEAVEAMPTVKVEDNNIQCSVCLEDFEIGTEAKEMPCKHKFHNGCILPWLELHSSCPVCRFQIPASEDGPKSSEAADESSSAGNVNNATNRPGESNGVEGGGGGGGEGENGRPSWLPIPWPFNGLFSLSASQNGGNSQSPRRRPSSSSSSTAAAAAAAAAGPRNNTTNHREEN